MSIRKKIYPIFLVVLFCLLTFGLVKSFFIEQADSTLPDGQLLVLDGKWEKVTGEQEHIKYKYKIPEEPNGPLVFSIECFSALDVYVDDVLLYQYEDPKAVRGYYRHWIELPENAAGKDLILTSASGENQFARTLNSFAYIGEKSAVYAQFLKENLSILIFGCIALVEGGIILLIGIYLRRKNAHRGILNLGVFILLAALWTITDSDILQLFTGKTAVVSFVSFFSFLIMPVFLLRFLEPLWVHSWKSTKILKKLFLINAAVSASVYLLQIVPIASLLLISHLLSLITIIFVLKNGIAEIRRDRNEIMRGVVFGFCLLSICGILALFAFYKNAISGYSDLYNMGMILFSLFLLDVAMKQIYRHIEESADAAAYKRLAYVDRMTKMGNRTAFMREQEANCSGERLSYIMLDINNLKHINDRYGHREGDQLITDAADCIRDIFFEIGKCFRVGGDEFVVILRDISEDEIKAVLHKLEIRLQEKNRERSVPLEIAFGYSIQKESSVTSQELFEEADNNMYLKKRNMKGEEYRNRWR